MGPRKLLRCTIFPGTQLSLEEPYLNQGVVLGLRFASTLRTMLWLSPAEGTWAEGSHSEKGERKHLPICPSPGPLTFPEISSCE